MGYCDFGRCECSLCSSLTKNGFCVYDTIDKCIHLAAVEDYKNAYKYIEHEPPKPNPDLVVVTRCKDCRLDGTEECGMRHGFMGHKDNDYCSYGERRNEETCGDEAN